VSALLQKYGSALDANSDSEEQVVYSLALLLRRVEDVMNDTLLIAEEEQNSLIEGTKDRKGIYFAMAELSSELIQAHFVSLRDKEKSKIKKKELAELVREGLKAVNTLIKSGVGDQTERYQTYHNQYVDYINIWYKVAVRLAYSIYSHNSNHSIFTEQVNTGLRDIKNIVAENPFIQSISGLDVDERLAIEIQQIDMTSKFYSEVYKNVLNSVLAEARASLDDAELKKYLLERNYLKSVGDEVRSVVSKVCNEVYGVIDEYIDEIAREDERND
jgi:CRISPR/Cas system CSM-associated protein Csm2 small subunit